MVCMGLGTKSDSARREEEEIKKKLAAQRKPSRRISREGDYIVIQERAGIKTSQAGTQTITEERVLINSDEYFYLLNKGVLNTG